MTALFLTCERLCLQSQTMQMMYDTVAKALKSMQISDSKPQDYLNFYCLGNREKYEGKDLSAEAAVVIYLAPKWPFV